MKILFTNHMILEYLEMPHDDSEEGGGVVVVTSSKMDRILI